MGETHRMVFWRPSIFLWVYLTATVFSLTASGPCAEIRDAYKSSQCCSADPDLQAQFNGTQTTCGNVKHNFQQQGCCSKKYNNTKLIPGVGLVSAVCDRTTDSPLVYLEFDSSDLAAINGGSVIADFSIDLPAGCPPYAHVFTSFASPGHPAWDMRSFAGGVDGGFGRPQFDIHFMAHSDDERVDMTVCTALADNPIQCDLSATDDATTKFTVLPDAEYMVGFFNDDSFGGHAVIGHGMHLIANVDVDVATCTSNGTYGNWADCHNQFISAYPASMGSCGSPGCAFVDHNCSCGYWQDGVSPILNSYNGRVIGNEIMPALDHVARLGSTLSNPYY